MGFKPLILGMIFGLFGCGTQSDEPPKEGGSDATSQTAISPTRETQKTSTDNTPFALEEGCYKNGTVPDAVCKIALAIFRRTNDQRTAQGKLPLKHHAGWHHVATQWSTAQALSGRISHDGFPEARWDAYVKEFGNVGMPDLAAENVGVVKIPDADDEGIAAAIADAWYASPAHRQNILGDYRYLGVGIVKTEDERFYATQLFAWDP